MNIRYPVLQQSLNVIRHIAPESVQQVVDIGVQRKTDFLMDVFPDIHHHLFEPVSVYYNDLEANYNKRGIQFTLHKLALADVNGVLFLHNTSHDGSGKVTHSQLVPHRNLEMQFLVNIEEIPTRRLDDVFAGNMLADLSYLVKLDVDGIEEKIIAGGERIISNASFIIIETSIGRRDLCSRAALLEKYGFRIFDICDNAYYFGQLALVDLVLINDRLRSSEIKFRPWEYSNGKVIWPKWQHGFTSLSNEQIGDPFA